MRKPIWSRWWVWVAGLFVVVGICGVILESPTPSSTQPAPSSFSELPPLPSVNPTPTVPEGYESVYACIEAYNSIAEVPFTDEILQKSNIREKMYADTGDPWITLHGTVYGEPSCSVAIQGESEDDSPYWPIFRDLVISFDASISLEEVRTFYSALLSGTGGVSDQEIGDLTITGGVQTLDNGIQRFTFNIRHK